jgi:hypothetical protein
MQTAGIAVGICAGLFILTCGVVGGRLLWLASRTRELPEFCIGAGLFTVAVVAFPLLGVSGLGAKTVSEVNLPVMTAGLVALLFAITNLYAFTWRVFRPTEWSSIASCFGA